MPPIIEISKVQECQILKGRNEIIKALHLEYVENKSSQAMLKIPKATKKISITFFFFLNSNLSH
jgi:hypothetical protein